jgi:rubrerythrin
MDRREQVERLHELARLDLEAATLYEAALQQVHAPLLERTLRLFAHDHRRHAEEVSARLVLLGSMLLQASRAGPPGEEAQGAQGQALPPLDGTVGPDAVLLALRQREQRTLQRYEELLEASWPVELRAVLIHCWADEQRHHAWLADALERRPWRAGAGSTGAGGTEAGSTGAGASSP